MLLGTYTRRTNIRPSIVEFVARWARRPIVDCDAHIMAVIPQQNQCLCHASGRVPATSTRLHCSLAACIARGNPLFFPFCAFGHRTAAVLARPARPNPLCSRLHDLAVRESVSKSRTRRLPFTNAEARRELEAKMQETEAKPYQVSRRWGAYVIIRR